MADEIRAKHPVLADDRSEYEAKREELKSAGIRYCLAAYTDVYGVGKAKCVPVEHFSGMMRGSELFTGAALDGLGQGPGDDELSVRPDLTRIVELPWMKGYAWAPGHLYYHHEPWPMCSRVVLQRAVDRAAALGYRFNLGIETEFYLVRREEGSVVPANPRDVLAKAAYDISDLLANMPFMDEVIGYMNQLGWDVHSFDHEDSNSQFEFDFSYTDVMSMADRQTLWRMMMKEVARRHGFELTLMPKPYANRTGTGAHFNMSLAAVESGDNLFADSQDPRGCGVSRLAYQFIAGVLAHAPALTAVAAPTVNSYKRLVKSGSMTGFTWAPVFRSYGGNNPGLDGIENDLDPGEPRRENMYLLSDAELAERGVKTLPRTLLEAVEAFDADALMERVFGPELKAAYVDLKSREWWDYHNHISAWEIDRYLTFF